MQTPAESIALGLGRLGIELQSLRRGIHNAAAADNEKESIRRLYAPSYASAVVRVEDRQKLSIITR